MSDIAVAIAMVAPYYNLAFTLVVIYLFVQLFKTYREGEGVYFAPWAFVFAALMVFVLEEIITILRQTQVIEIPLNINGFFEMVIISLFIYAVLLQKAWITKVYEKHVPLRSSPRKSGKPSRNQKLSRNQRNR